MVGSAMYLITTGKPQSQTRTVLSSEVEMKRRLSSTNVIELTAAKCWSYSCTISPVLTSHCPVAAQACGREVSLKHT